MTALTFESPVTIGLPDAPEAGAVLQPDNPVAIAVVLEGPQGIPGPAGDFPAGGDQGQVLAKASAADSDVEWVDVEVAVDLAVSIDADGTLIVDGTTVELATDAQLSSHTGNTSNPHSVTKTQVGLGNVDNTSDAAKPVSTLQAAADATVLASAATDATTKANTAASGAATALSNHEADTTNVHGIADTSALATTSSVTTAVGVETSRATTAEALLAPKASPALTGTPTAPTATGGTNTTQVATTAFATAAVSALSSVYQPLDTDLTNIAALTTTSYGRAFLELANQAATMGLLSAATASAQGIVELATTGETTTGTDTVRAVTPAGVKAATDALSTVYQPLDSDLTSIAALTTTTYGRAFLALANQAALFALFTGTPSSTTYLRGDGTWSTPSGGGGSVATDTIFDAKGDLAVGTGSDTASKLTVGANNTVLTADSAQSTGVKWAAPAARYLGKTFKTNATNTTVTTTSASQTPIDSTNLSLTVTVPANGEIEWSSDFVGYTTGSSQWGFIGILDGSNVLVTGSEKTMLYGVAGTVHRSYYRWIETGLTPGASVTRRLGFTIGANTLTLEYGGRWGPIPFYAETT